MVRHSKLQNQPSQEDRLQMRRTIQNRIKTRTKTYWLKLPKTWKIHNVFHATLLHPYIKNEIYGNNYLRPPAELLEGEEVYKVDSILKHWRREEDINTTSNGKDIRLQKQHGKMAACWNNTNSKTNSESLSITTCLLCNRLNPLQISKPKPPESDWTLRRWNKPSLL